MLKENDMDFRKLYDEIPIAHFTIGIDKSIKRCNNYAVKLLEYSKEELMNLKVFDLYSDLPEGKSKAKNIFQLFLRGEEIFNEELLMKKKDGTNVWINLTIIPVLNQDGKVIESHSLALDITDRKKTEDELKES